MLEFKSSFVTFTRVGHILLLSVGFVCFIKYSGFFHFCKITQIMRIVCVRVCERETYQGLIITRGLFYMISSKIIEVKYTLGLHFINNKNTNSAKKGNLQDFTLVSNKTSTHVMPIKKLFFCSISLYETTKIYKQWLN